MADEMGPEATAAAELALGLLEGPELREAEARRRDDPAFAEEVYRWERHFELWFSRWPEAVPPASSHEAIIRATGLGAANDNPARKWKIATIISSAVAAGLALFLAVPREAPPVVIPTVERATFLAAALTAEDGVTKMPAIIELPRKQLRMPAGLEVPAGHSAQVWLIAGTAAPAPVGILRASAGGMAADLTIPETIPGGSTLAISIEPAGGSPTGQPTGPVVASGALIQI